MPFVLDTSMTLAWHFDDEATDFTAATLRRLNRDRALAPALWPFEVANGLVVAERRGRIGSSELAIAVERTLSLPIDIQAASLQDTLGTVSSLARVHRLTVYDAAYLHLAMREELPIASLDAALLAAARAEGLPDFEP